MIMNGDMLAAWLKWRNLWQKRSNFRKAFLIIDGKIILIAIIVLIFAGVGAFFILKLMPRSATPEISRSLTHYNVFVLHFEPRSAGWLLDDEVSFRRLQQWVAFAEEHNQKFGLGFTPQWAEMISQDPAKLSFVQQLFDKGWDLVPHHHGVHHGHDWDGYCAYGAERCMAVRQKYYRGHPSPLTQRWYKEKERYIGSMDDYVALMKKLYPNFRVVTMGVDRFFDDWHKSFKFSMDSPFVKFASGRPIFDEPADVDVEGVPPVTHFEKRDLNGKIVYECGAMFLANREELERAKKLYEDFQEKAPEGDFFSVVLHIEDDEDLFKDWIEFLHSKDPEGKWNTTITKLARDFEMKNALSP